MKKFISILAVILVAITVVFSVTASALNVRLANDKFIAEIPENFKINTDMGYDYYYLENEDYTYTIEIMVKGNFAFPDGLKYAENEVIIRRFSDIYFGSELSGSFNANEVKKQNLNGITVCKISGVETGESIWSYIFATKEAVFVVTCSSFEQTETPEFFEKFIQSFYINGTHYNGERLAKNIDFSNEIHYIDAIERDVLTDKFYEYNSDMNDFALGLFAVAGIFPIGFIVLLVLYIKTKHKLNEYKEFFGTIEEAKRMMNQRFMQSAIPNAPYQNNGQYFENSPQGNPYNSQSAGGQYQPSGYSGQAVAPELKDSENNK